MKSWLEKYTQKCIQSIMKEKSAVAERLSKMHDFNITKWLYW